MKNTHATTMSKTSLLFMVKAAVIAAIYAALTILLAPISYGPVQVRVAEMLTILPVFDPAAIPGLAIGCLVANVYGGIPLDWVFGTTATLLAAVCTYALRRVRWGKLPVLATLPPVLFNAVIIGAELAIFYSDGFSLPVFLTMGAEVGAGQLIACVGGGLLLYIALRPAAKRIFSDQSAQ